MRLHLIIVYFCFERRRLFRNLNSYLHSICLLTTLSLHCETSRTNFELFLFLRYFNISLFFCLLLVFFFLNILYFYFIETGTWSWFIKMRHSFEFLQFFYYNKRCSWDIYAFLSGVSWNRVFIESDLKRCTIPEKKNSLKLNQRYFFYIYSTHDLLI